MAAPQFDKQLEDLLIKAAGGGTCEEEWSDGVSNTNGGRHQRVFWIRTSVVRVESALIFRAGCRHVSILVMIILIS
jgi:hypothetical protein